MSDVYDTRRFHGGGAEREPDAAKPAPVACANPQSAWDVEDRRQSLRRQVANLGEVVAHNKTSGIISAGVICGALLILIWRQQANFDEHIHAEREATVKELKKVHIALEQLDEEREAVAGRVWELYSALERVAVVAEENRKIIADLRTKLAEIPKHAYVVIQDPPEQKTEKAADAPSWPPKPATLAELRQYDGEEIAWVMERRFDGNFVRCVCVEHLLYAYGERGSRLLFLSAKDFALMKDKEVFDVQLLEDAHRNR